MQNQRLLDSCKSMPMRRLVPPFAAMLAAAVLTCRPLPAEEPIGPSFPCRYAQSRAEILVCQSVELSELDRQLAGVFDNTRYQAGVDAKALRRDEEVWLKDVRDACADAECLRRAYSRRIEVLRDQSRKAASPAAYEETQPFPIPESLWAEARGLIGKPCDGVRDDRAPASGGFRPIPGFLPIVVNGGVVYPRAKGPSKFAFLATTQDTPSFACRIEDVVVLPGPSLADAFLECDMNQPGYTSFPGIGMRLGGRRKLVGYWTIDVRSKRLIREPISVLAAESSVRCHEPETGE